jgi:hypothetical protein
MVIDYYSNKFVQMKGGAMTRLLAIGVIVGATALTIMGCSPGSTLLMAPNAESFTSAGKTAKFVVSVDGGSKPTITGSSISGAAQFKFVSGSEFGECIGHQLISGTLTCTETIKLTELKSGLKGELVVTPKIGTPVVAKLSTP